MMPLGRILTMLRPYWRCLFKSLLVGALVSVLALPGPYITKLLIDEVYPRQDVALLHFVLLTGAVVTVILGGIQALGAHFNQRVGVLVSYDFQSRFYAHIQNMDFGFFDQRETGELLSRFDDMQRSFAHVVGMLNALVLNILQLLIFPALLFWICWPLALVSLAVLPFDTLLAAITRSYFGRLSKAIAEGEAHLSATAYESLAGVRTVQALGAEARFMARLRALFLRVAGLQIRASLVQNASAVCGTVLRSGGHLAYAYYGWLQVLGGELSMGTFMAFSGYVAYLYSPIQNLIGLIPQMEVALVHTRRFLEIYDQQPAIRDLPGAIRADRVRGVVDMRDVWFAYGSTPVLRGASLRIPAGTTTALVGRSGAGKSSLAKLIPRFYDPDRGCVRLDGRDIRRYEVRSLRRQIGFAMQGSRLFHGTIRDNLCLGRDVPAADMEAAAAAACIHEVIMALADGYATEVGENGSGLSEGQRQRLALARVLLLDTPVLILDEPTAALDTESEARLRQALTAVCAGRTTLIIAHRLSTIQMADQILVLQDGAIAEQGCHEQLLRDQGAYARLCAAGTGVET